MTSVDAFSAAYQVKLIELFRSPVDTEAGGDKGKSSPGPHPASRASVNIAGDIASKVMDIVAQRDHMPSRTIDTGIAYGELSGAGELVNRIAQWIEGGPASRPPEEELLAAVTDFVLLGAQERGDTATVEAIEKGGATARRSTDVEELKWGQKFTVTESDTGRSAEFNYDPYFVSSEIDVGKNPHIIHISGEYFYLS